MHMKSNDYRRLRFLVLVGTIAASLGAAPTVLACVEGDIRGESVTTERDMGALATGEEASVQIVGAGWFHAAEITKQGGSNDHTQITIDLDGVPLISTSFATLKDPWMQVQTQYIVAMVRTEGDVSMMSLWYTPDLKFNMQVRLRIEVQEDGVESFKVRTVLSKALPHSHPNGQGAILALPAFK